MSAVCESHRIASPPAACRDGAFHQLGREGSRTDGAICRLMVRLEAASFLNRISESIARLMNSGTDMMPHSGCSSIRHLMRSHSARSIFKVIRSSLAVATPGTLSASTLYASYAACATTGSSSHIRSDGRRSVRFIYVCTNTVLQRVGKDGERGRAETLQPVRPGTRARHGQLPQMRQRDTQEMRGLLTSSFRPHRHDNDRGMTRDPDSKTVLPSEPLLQRSESGPGRPHFFARTILTHHRATALSASGPERDRDLGKAR